MKNIKQKLKLIETFDETPCISLNEEEELFESDNHKSRVDGKYIIGMIEGQFFKPDGMSRNRRWYPRSLWEKVLNTSDVKNRFLTSTMFGEIGHSDGPVEDLTLRNGCASHFIDKLWITPDGKGMGRAYILNTPTGQLLKTYLGAGCKLKVSTRGEGLFKEGCTHEGCPVVDDDTYELQTADFVLNPGFMETNATLKEDFQSINDTITKNQNQITETINYIKKEGENRMTLDIEAYVRELKEELKSVKAKNESLNEELKAKEKELLEKSFKESAEVQKLNEEIAPFKKFKVSAKTLNETLQRSQNLLKKTKEEKVKIEEELKSYKDKCGSLEQIDEATKLSTKSLSLIEQYRKFGTPKDIEQLAKHAEALVYEIQESRKLAENVTRILPRLKESQTFKESYEKAVNIINSYKKLVGTLKEAKELSTAKDAKINESVTDNTNKNLLKEALSVSKKYGCTVESASKLVKKYGLEKANKLMETATAKKEVKTGLQEGTKLIEEVAQLDKVTSVPEEKSAKDYVTAGMIKNYFNHDALGKEVTYDNINTIDGTKPQKPNAAKELLKKYNTKFQVETAPTGLNKELTPAQAEAEAKKLLK